MNTSPLIITSQLAREPLPVTGEQQVAYILLEFRANPAFARQTPYPLDLSIVVDRSVSMRGVRLAQAKQAIGRIIDTLSEQDTLSVVSFDDMVDVVIHQQPISNANELKSDVDFMEEGAGTILSLGVRMGIAELHKTMAPDRLPHMFLLLDGPSRDDAYQKDALLDEAKQNAIAIDTFGIGAEWEAQVLEYISEQTGGAPPIYIKNPNDLANAMVERLDAIHTTEVRGVTAIIRFVNGVTPRHVTRVSPFMRPVDHTITERTIELTLGNFIHDIPYMLLIETLIEPKRGGTFRIAQVEANYNTEQKEIATLQSDIVVTFSGSAAKRPQVRPIVLHYTERATAGRLLLQHVEGHSTEPLILSPGMLNIFDSETREMIESLIAGATMTPETRKFLMAKVHDLTLLRQTTTASES